MCFPQLPLDVIGLISGESVGHENTSIFHFFHVSEAFVGRFCQLVLLGDGARKDVTVTSSGLSRLPDRLFLLHSGS